MKYFWATIRHKWFVLLASFQVRLPVFRALVHDLSKFGRAELWAYDRQFFGDKGDEPGFAVAWLHHQNFNDHHWEYWITRGDHSKGKSLVVSGCLPMPDICVAEMIADWMGASKAYTGSWVMTGWLEKNLTRIQVHPGTMDRILRMLAILGYQVYLDRFANTCTVYRTE